MSEWCDHKGSVTHGGTGCGWKLKFFAICTVCNLVGPTKKDLWEALESFWNLAKSNKEKPMICENHKHGVHMQRGASFPGSVRSVCKICSFVGPEAKTIKEADQLLEKPMTSEYRRGVEDATKPLYAGYDMVPLTVGQVNKNLDERRKLLLTKKVTKWVRLYRGDEVKLSADRALFDSKEVANYGQDLCANFAGVYPIEIEVPID